STECYSISCPCKYIPQYESNISVPNGTSVTGIFAVHPLEIIAMIINFISNDKLEANENINKTVVAYSLTCKYLFFCVRNLHLVLNLEPQSRVFLDKKNAKGAEK